MFATNLSDVVCWDSRLEGSPTAWGGQTSMSGRVESWHVSLALEFRNLAPTTLC